MGALEDTAPYLLLLAILLLCVGFAAVYALPVGGAVQRFLLAIA